MTGEDRVHSNKWTGYFSCTVEEGRKGGKGGEERGREGEGKRERKGGRGRKGGKEEKMGRKG